MSTVTGILLDVSGSMRSSIGDGVDEEGGTWARSIFTVIDNLVTHDVSNDNRVFSVGFGGKDKAVFDTIGTIKLCQSEDSSYRGPRLPATGGTIEHAFQVLESNGARTIRRWASEDVVSRAVSENEARLLLDKLRSDGVFTWRFVHEYLPRACRDWDSSLPEVLPRPKIFGFDLFSGIVQGAQSVSSFAASSFRQATVEDIRIVVKKALLDKKVLLVDVNNQSIYNVHEAADVIHGSVNEQDLTKARARELLEVVEPFIYGGTPLYAALNEASHLLSMSANSFPNHRRLLFVLSDGMATDGGSIDIIMSQLRRLDVTVVTTYISRSSSVEPRRLHSYAGQNWEDGAKFLFNLSSTVPTEYVTRAIFMKHGWKIDDITNNETRLFMHVNHPDNLKDVCDLARNAVCCQDALLDVLVSVKLDVYINQKNIGTKAHSQVGGTCYANASAVVLHLAMHRILGRDDGYPDFEELRDDMINRHGEDGANTFRVLQEVCPLYRLKCRKVDVNGAMKAIEAKRPVVARFRLTDGEWETFGRFYRNNATGILKKSDLDISRRNPNARTGGHAVVLTSYNSECFRLMNSWGEEWADMGFFRIESADVLELEFIDVFWTPNDLSMRERDYYSAHGSEVAATLMMSLKGLQVAKFTCPSCWQESKVTEFKGSVSRALCPRCKHQFSSTDGDGNILALNMYLTSLSR